MTEPWNNLTLQGISIPQTREQTWMKYYQSLSAKCLDEIQPDDMTSSPESPQSLNGDGGYGPRYRGTGMHPINKSGILPSFPPPKRVSLIRHRGFSNHSSAAGSARSSLCTSERYAANCLCLWRHLETFQVSQYAVYKEKRDFKFDGFAIYQYIYI